MCPAYRPSQSNRKSLAFPTTEAKVPFAGTDRRAHELGIGLPALVHLGIDGVLSSLRQAPAQNGPKTREQQRGG